MTKYISDIKLPQIKAQTTQVQLEQQSILRIREIPTFNLIESASKNGIKDIKQPPLTERRSLEPLAKQSYIQKIASIRTIQYSPLSVRRGASNLFDFESVSTESSIKSPPIVTYKFNTQNKELLRKKPSDDECDLQSSLKLPQVNVEETVSELDQSYQSIKSPIMKPRKLVQKHLNLREPLFIQIPQKSIAFINDESPPIVNSQDDKVKVILCRNLKSLTPGVLADVAQNSTHQINKSRFYKINS